MKGSVYKRGATWTYQFAIQRNGKRRFATKGGFRTKKECEDALTTALSEHQLGTQVEPSKLTLTEYLRKEWLPLQVVSKKPSTLRGYRDIVERRIIPHLGEVRLRDLSSRDVARLYTILRESGRVNGKGGLSEQSIKHTHSVLHSALEHAVEAGYLGRNAARSLPRASRPRPRRVETQTWTALELRAFLAAVAGDRLVACFALAATSGLRRGELLGLRWDDVDLEHCTLAVRRSRVSAGYEVTEGEPKSGRSRTVSIDSETTAMLRRHRARQLQERMAWGEAWSDCRLVFTREDGTPIHPHSLSQTFSRRVKRAKVPQIRFHDLRHTHATLLLSAGVHPKVVQERLGHASISITLDTYSHVAPGMQEAAAAKLGAMVFGA